MKRMQTGGQGGFALIEALVSIAVFSFALIGLVGMQSLATGATTDAKDRSNASYLANQLIGQVWADRGNIANYNHMNTGAACTPSGAATINPVVLQWLADIQATLPGAPNNVQSVSIGAGNTITVTVCWKRAHDAAFHRHVTVAQIN